jgi:hypothetical protein
MKINTGPVSIIVTMVCKCSFCFLHEVRNTFKRGCSSSGRGPEYKTPGLPKIKNNNKIK